MNHFNKLNVLLFLTTALSSFSAVALPTGGQVSAGTASITNGTNTTTINQSSQRAVIDWGTYNVASGQTVNYNQADGSSSITLNRINDTNQSVINGAVNANGQVWFINPNGILFGQNAQVNVGGLLATTSNITNANFMNGSYSFTPGGGSASATVSNQGNITVAQAGLAALVAPNVANSGTIKATASNISLASGDTFGIDIYGDNLVYLQASPAILQQSVKNTGTLNAGNNTIELTAAAASNVVDSLVNLDGLEQAWQVVASNQSGDVEVSSNITNANVYVSASHNITVEPNVQITSNSGPIYVSLDSNDANAGSGFIDVLSGAQIASDGGNISLTGGPLGYGYAIGNYDLSRGYDENFSPVSFNGIYLDGATLNAGGGNITLQGEGANYNGSLQYPYHVYLMGVRLYNSTLETNGNGSINVQGIGGASTNPYAVSWGVYISPATIQTANGAITINGTGGAAPDSLGIDIETAYGLIDSVNGNITLTGQGGTGASQSGGSNGIIDFANIETTGTQAGSGNIALNGTGGAGMDSEGVELDGPVISTNAGNISITGTASTNSSAYSNGVNIYLSNIQSTGTAAGEGNISIVGIGGGGGYFYPYASDGILFTDSTIATVAGNINLNGTGGTGAMNAGIRFDFADLGDAPDRITSTGQGNIVLTGYANANGDAISNFGPDDIYANAIVSAAHGNITVNANSLQISQYGSYVDFSTPGTVTFAPTAALEGIDVAYGGMPGQLGLTTSILNDVTARNIVIGSTADSGLMTVEAYNWRSNVSFLDGLGSIKLTGVNSSAANDNITFATLYGDFINTAGAGALEPGAGGRWLIYSENPAHDTLDGLVPNFTLYNCTYGSNCNLPAGNGLIYSQPQGSPLNESLLLPAEEGSSDDSTDSKI